MIILVKHYNVILFSMTNLKTVEKMNWKYSSAKLNSRLSCSLMLQWFHSALGCSHYPGLVFSKMILSCPHFLKQETFSNRMGLAIKLEWIRFKKKKKWFGDEVVASKLAYRINGCKASFKGIKKLSIDLEKASET